MDEIAARTGLQRSDLLDPEARLSDDLPAQLWLLIRSIAGVGPLPLHMARATSFSIFGPWVYPLRFAPDLRTALSTMTEYQAVLADRVQLTMSQHGEWTRMSASHPNDHIDGGLTNELGIAMTWRLLNEVLGCGSCVARVELVRANDEFVPQYEAFFANAVHVKSQLNAIVFHSEALDRSTREGDTALYQYACEHLELLAERYDVFRPPDPLEPIRIAVVKTLAAKASGIDAVAAEIHMSPRSLQRLVKSHGTTVRNIIEQVRATEARKLVAESDLDFLTVARRLGYSDDRSFRRAFQRWTGSSPAAFRRG